MSFLEGDALARVQSAPPGLQLAVWFDHIAEALSEDSRALLSYAVSGLVSRGWISTPEKLVDNAVEAVGESHAKLKTALDELESMGMVRVDNGRFTSLAGVLSLQRTKTSYFMTDDAQVHLLGPLAALAVPKGLGRPGEVMANCAVSDPLKRLTLECDERGVHSRSPDTIAMFLPYWDGTTHPSDAIAGGGLFVDDAALAQWQEANPDVDGMPLSSVMFPMAATDLGARTGKALEAVLDRYASFG
jgi:hypothetical protein